MRSCRVCKVELPEPNFKTRKDGRKYTRCKSCHNRAVIARNEAFISNIRNWKLSLDKVSK